VTEFPTTLTPANGPNVVTIIVGPDGNIWFNEFLADRIGRLEIATGKVTEFRCGISPFSGPLELTLGTDGNIWFTEVGLNPAFPGRVARLVPAVAAQFTTPSRCYVSTLYADLLGRDPDPQGLAYFSTVLDQGLANRTQVALAVQGSLEYRVVSVQREYLRLLHRPADPFGLNAFVNFLTGGGQLVQVTQMILSSPEYLQTRGGGTAAGFLAALYHDVLRRPVDPVGAAAFGPMLAAGAPTAAVATAVLFSQEAAAGLIGGLYGRFLSRDPDPQGLGVNLHALQSGVPAEFLAAELFGSDEYLLVRVTGPTPLPPGGPPPLGI
jgi:hypothetical protein